MGTSKVIFASGVFVIIGMYSLSFRTADQATTTVALAQAYRNQAEQIAVAGAKFASIDLGSNRWAGLIPSSTVSLMGGSVTYKTDWGTAGSQMRLTTEGSYQGHTVKYLATMQWVSPRWKVERIYLAPNADDFSRLN
ncbi:MAG: hypothetical protein NTV54_04210 [Ignavibacteriales bacterium]|nr:hypothetical protein [Ignavibacteriales bacterium]